MPMENDILISTKKQFSFYKQLGEKTFDQLKDEHLFHQFNEDSNSVATIVKHLWGNMLSRWTDFLHTDGEKEWRDREGEFETPVTSRQEMMEKWAEGWNCLFQALDSLHPEDLDKIIYIRNQGHTVMETILRQLAHYSYHVGQIVYVGKMLAENGWDSLSIPRGGSADYNKDKFSKPKSRTHFTDEHLKGDEEK